MENNNMESKNVYIWMSVLALYVVGTFFRGQICTSLQENKDRKRWKWNSRFVTKQYSHCNNNKRNKLLFLLSHFINTVRFDAVQDCLIHGTVDDTCLSLNLKF